MSYFIDELEYLNSSPACKTIVFDSEPFGFSSLMNYNPYSGYYNPPQMISSQIDLESSCYYNDFNNMLPELREDFNSSPIDIPSDPSPPYYSSISKITSLPSSHPLRQQLQRTQQQRLQLYERERYLGGITNIQHLSNSSEVTVIFDNPETKPYNNPELTDASNQITDPDASKSRKTLRASSPHTSANTNNNNNNNSHKHNNVESSIPVVNGLLSSPSPSSPPVTEKIPQPLWTSRKRKCWCNPQTPCKYCKDHSEGGNRFHRACSMRPEYLKKTKKKPTNFSSLAKKPIPMQHSYGVINLLIDNKGRKS